jgi:hypothetical protein
MQKVEGSSPFSRLTEKPSKSEGFSLLGRRGRPLITPALPLGATKPRHAYLGLNTVMDAGSHGDAEGDLSLLQLFHVEVPRERLQEDGVALDEVLAEFQPLHGELGSEEIPSSGWRVVSDRPPLATVGRRVTLAAPHETVRGGWVMLDLGMRDGGWRPSVHAGPVGVRPGKAPRRRPSTPRPTLGPDPR